MAKNSLPYMIHFNIIAAVTEAQLAKIGSVEIFVIIQNPLENCYPTVPS